MQTLVEHKWNSYVEDKFFFHLKLNIALLFSLTADALAYKTAMASDHIALKILGYVPMIVTLVLWSFFAAHEFRQWQSNSATSKHTKTMAHLNNFWNFLDALSLVSIFAAYTCRGLEFLFGFLSVSEGIGETAIHLSSLVMAFALPVTYLNSLFYLQGFEEAGELIRMIIGIIKGVKVFLVILIVCMVGFAAGFFILYENGTDHQSPFFALFSSYTLMLGDFDVDNFRASSSFVSASSLFFAFTAFINIVMLNLLIAIMGDIFDKIQEN
eukprot:CAMPEP_0182494976 /NCGR_PEP_ID=MMETSP1321-20130603/3800_1 /TAXON_ID=91990 /ORGANISM="Bolidomonas sp., Strain RCC1657" /LENGTH=268 /DNA_ID=CAMNT_0024698211 /DNA_START=1 /DNA_END=804 /DNA_ORIENTATION=+